MGRDTSQISTHVDINTRFSEIRVELDKGGNPSLGLELQHVTRARDDSCECAKPAVPRIEGRKLELRLDLVIVFGWAVGSIWAVGRMLAMGNGQWAVGSGQWAVCGQWAVGSEQ